MSFMDINLPSKFLSINESITINFYDNGFMLEVTGEDENDNWVCAKIIFTSLHDIFTLLEQFSTLKKCR